MEVLDEERTVKSELFPKLCERSRRRVFAQDENGRVSRNEPQDEEDTTTQCQERQHGAE
jgi:hypothetical protein